MVVFIIITKLVIRFIRGNTEFKVEILKGIRMMKFYVFIISVFLNFAQLSAADKINLSGKVTDKKTGESLPGVSIYLPDLKTGTTTDTSGYFVIRNLPQTRVLLQLNYVGYRTLVETVDLSVTNTANFAMEYSATEINEVVVTGLTGAAEQKRTPAPVTVVPRLSLLQNSSVNIIDALAAQPGVSQITTGTGISKPVIRGLGYNRVVVVNDGIRQEGQQWGDEHGIEIDEYAVDRVEIIKGPASLAYGSDALAGVISMMSAPPLSEGRITGNLISNYQTNNGLSGISAAFAGNQKGIIWDIRFSHKSSHAYRNRYDGYVFNSGFKENSVDVLAGLNRSWGYSRLRFSIYNMTPGIIEGERDSLSGRFVRQIALNDSVTGSQIVPDKVLRSYELQTPYQKIHHYKAVLDNSIILGKSTLKTLFGFQQNQRQEYGNVRNPGAYGLFFLLSTLNYDVQYLFPEFNKWSVISGINGMYQTSRNKGIEYLVPEYNLFDFGLYTVAKKSLGEIDISGGLRLDSRTENSLSLYINSLGEKVSSPGITSYTRFQAFNSVFTGISGSLGATWQMSKALYTKINLSKGFRAPNISELGSNGVHEGTNRYETGNHDLAAEHSLEGDYTLGLNSEHISSELDLFTNSIRNFIFSRKLSGSSGGDSITQGIQTFKFVSGNALIQGMEFRIDVHPHPLDWIHFENSISLVTARQKNQPDSTRYLPSTPATKLQSALRFNSKKAGRIYDNAYFKIEMEYYFRQNRFYSAFGTETATPAYSLINIGLGTDFTKRDRTIGSLYISVNNLTDVAYQSHLSRLKYTPENYRTGRTGIYNMGRNISFRLIIPLHIKGS